MLDCSGLIRFQHPVQAFVPKFHRSETRLQFKYPVKIII